MVEKASATRQDVASPCIRNCCLNEDDICLGCYRSLQEICSWSSLSNQDRGQVLHNANARKSLSNNSD
ncbi:MAG: hypothetical protein OFPII_21390 [Osedax symbiont Rs1]|nr:MAG: hypothetical protein OFPII_21390 [Osedax symbiont Rs1]